MNILGGRDTTNTMILKIIITLTNTMRRIVCNQREERGESYQKISEDEINTSERLVSKWRTLRTH